MTNEGLKKKIISALQSVEFVTEKGWCGQCISLRLDYSAIADALIAAGIGDVSELKKHRVIVEQSPVPTDDNCYILPNTSPIIKQLYSGKEVEQIAKEREEYKHRAARAERALENACEDVKETVSFLIELSERVDGLRVEGYLPEESEPKAYINRAEKELAEEGKDD